MKNAKPKIISSALTTQQHILDVAEGLIKAYGYNGFSLDDISKQVGIRKPSILHHFSSKAELGVAVTQRYTKHFATLLAAIETRHINSKVMIEAYIELFYSAYHQDRQLCLCGMLGAEADALPETLKAEIQHFFQLNLEWLSRIFKLGRDKSELKFAEQPKHRALTLLAGLEGAMLVGREMKTVNPVKIVGLLMLGQV